MVMAVLEERMDAMNERYDRGWKHLEARMGEDRAKLEAKIGEDYAKRDAEFSKLREDIAKRDTANTRWLIGIITAATAIIIAVMAVLLSTT